MFVSCYIEFINLYEIQLNYKQLLSLDLIQVENEREQTQAKQLKSEDKKTTGQSRRYPKL